MNSVKNNFMKKILLTGVVLILLIILAADFYMDRNRAFDRRNNSQASATLPDNTATAAVTTDNSAQDLNDDIAPATSSSVTNSGKHKHRYAKHAAPVDESLADNTSDADGLYVVTGDDAEPIAAESSKEFTGNMPPKNNLFHSTATTRRKTHFGFEAGALQNSFYNDNSSRMSTTGFFVGGVADVGLSNHLYLQPGVRYERKGQEVETIMSNPLMTVDTKDKINLNYIEVPVNFVVKFGDWHDVRFMVGAGPYISYLASAEDKFQTTTTSTASAARTTLDGANTVTPHVTAEQGQHSIPVGDNSTAGSIRRLDWGANGFIGCEAPGGLFIKAGSEVGLMNIQQNTNGSYSNRNLNFFVSLGYLIGSKK